MTKQEKSKVNHSSLDFVACMAALIGRNAQECSLENLTFMREALELRAEDFEKEGTPEELETFRQAYPRIVLAEKMLIG